MVIDLNADLGEGFPHDAKLLEHVSSASVACGGHAGDASTMARTCALAVARGVSIGAHVSYPDREEFGRRETGLSAAEIGHLVFAQIGELASHAASVGAAATFVKPHGALYHRASHDAAVAEAIADAVRAAEPTLCILGPPDSTLLEAAERAGLTAVAEGFADRAYERAGVLVSRDRDGALLTPGPAAKQAVMLAREGRVVLADGRQADLSVGSICVHGDAPEAAATAAAVAAALARAGVRVEPFA